MSVVLDKLFLVRDLVAGLASCFPDVHLTQDCRSRFLTPTKVG